VRILIDGGEASKGLTVAGGAVRWPATARQATPRLDALPADRPGQKHTCWATISRRGA
jgi:hypothetical protein